MPKTQRVLDPLHGLIVFREEDETDQVAWKLINSREFQRLRRIRQLGFSEFVFPGATHTRFNHCVGVYHAARQLLSKIEKKQPSSFDLRKRDVAALSALLHDLGHGPFSHAFENAERQRGIKKKHTTWTSEIIQGDTEIHDILQCHDSEFPTRVATLLESDEPQDIYAAVVSSEFDADRLDFLRRDRIMTGSSGGDFDFEWLLDCLEIGKITISLSGENDFADVDSFYLNHKGLKAAENYLLARRYYYLQVYYHKTTRAAEKMLGALLVRLSHLALRCDASQANLPNNHPLIKFYSDTSDTDGAISRYLALDDTVIWAALAQMREGKDEFISELAGRLLDRKLYKCIDIGARAQRLSGSDVITRFRKALKDKFPDNEALGATGVLSDRTKITVYGKHEFDEGGAHQKVLIRPKDETEQVDIHELSPLIKNVPEEEIFRVYVANHDLEDRIEEIWREVSR